MTNAQTHRATSFLVITGPNGSRRVALTDNMAKGKVKTKSTVVWVNFSEFMVAFNLVMGASPCVVTLAGTPCRFKPAGGLMQVTCKKKAPHGLRHNVQGRTKYNRNLKDTHY